MDLVAVGRSASIFVDVVLVVVTVLAVAVAIIAIVSLFDPLPAATHDIDGL